MLVYDFLKAWGSNWVKKLDFTSLLQMLIEKEVGIKIVFTKDKWISMREAKTKGIDASKLNKDKHGVPIYLPSEE